MFLFLILYNTGARLTTEEFTFTEDRHKHLYVGAFVGLTTSYLFDKFNKSDNELIIQKELRNYIIGLNITSYIAVQKEIYDYRRGGELNLADYLYTLLGYTIGYITNRFFKYVILTDLSTPKNRR